jgi:ABC-2 type transport system ATP-binding protein
MSLGIRDALHYRSHDGAPTVDGNEQECPMNVIEVHDLQKKYEDVEAVRGIGFDVRGRKVLALLGPNGAGKTTVVEILEGYRLRTGGDVEVLGEDPASASRRFRERVGIVLQHTGVQPMLSVREVLEMYGSYYPRPRRVGELLELVGVSGNERVRVEKLSGGQRRRLDLALALVGDPDLLFLDEPTTGFDHHDALHGRGRGTGRSHRRHAQRSHRRDRIST